MEVKKVSAVSTMEFSNVAGKSYQVAREWFTISVSRGAYYFFPATLEKAVVGLGETSVFVIVVNPLSFICSLC